MVAVAVIITRHKLPKSAAPVLFSMIENHPLDNTIRSEYSSNFPHFSKARADGTKSTRDKKTEGQKSHKLQSLLRSSKGELLNKRYCVHRQPAAPSALAWGSGSQHQGSDSKSVWSESECLCSFHGVYCLPHTPYLFVRAMLLELTPQVQLKREKEKALLSPLGGGG